MHYYELEKRKRVLQKQQADVKKRIEEIKETMEKEDERLLHLKRQKWSIEKEICKLKEKNREVIVSEHAMLHYVEKVMGLDIDIIKSSILNKNTKVLMGTLGDGKFPLPEGGRAVVKNNVVVTIIEN